MKSFTTNWKTTATGALLIGLAVLKVALGIDVGLDPTTAIIAGTGMLFAKDGNVTGGTTTQ